MEFANGGSLFNMVRTQRRLKESMARWFFQQLILAVDYCHKRGVANRDIKLENLLLHMEEGLPHPLLKMCDFGYSKADFRSAAKSQVGTLSYMAPEVMKSCGAYYDAKVADVWSCGVVLYVMLYGIYPFDNHGEDNGLSEAQKVRKMLDRMEKEAYALNPSVAVGEECLDMLKGLLKPQPEQRFTIEKVMEHPWFNKKLPPQVGAASLAPVRVLRLCLALCTLVPRTVPYDSTVSQCFCPPCILKSVASAGLAWGASRLQGVV